jgi:3-deoxy-D-manno-octulosonate 8-phosphate phosphatase (KDO 8-P phosphatase)
MVDLTEIKLLVLDVDGVLTDGTVIINADGSESKFFHTLDGHGIRMWRRSGLEVAIISGRESEPTQRRAAQLGIEHVFQDCHFKLPVIEELLGRLNMTPEQVAYVGDDLMDLPVIRYVGFGVAVADAVDEVKQHADYVTTKSGGKGAVRETIEHILKGTDKWDKLMERYLS